MTLAERRYDVSREKVQSQQREGMTSAERRYDLSREKV
jgi:hypothetical protein